MHTMVRKILMFAAFLAMHSALTGCSHSLFKTGTEPSQTKQAKPLGAHRPVIGATHTYEQTDVSLSQPNPHSLQPQDLWHRIRGGYQLSHEQHPLIDEYVEWFQANHSVIDKSSRRAAPLLYHIVESIEAKGLPTELALIPLLESGYRVHARSPYGAVGPWQFMPATGRHYGLTQTAFLDKRRDIVLSTAASLAYLQHLRKQFHGDWLLAIAAYNGGPGNVRKAVGNSRQSFWRVAHRLPPETRQYVPKLLAAARIIQAPESYNQKIQQIPNKKYFESIQVNGPVDFSVLEDLPNWDKKLFRRLNGGLSSDYYGAKDSLAVRVPLGFGVQVIERLKTAGPPKMPATDIYLVRRGDTLSEISTQFDVPIGELKKVNGIHGHSIRAGNKIKIPVNNVSNKQLANKSLAHEHRHIVRSGDSFWTLGRRFGISARTLARHNGHAINATLYPGQLLLIPQVAQQSAATKASSLVDYMVRNGDSLWSIAKRFNVKLSDLKRWNPLLTSNLLRPGQKLLVRAP